ncbi:hypothetical protein [Hymenobacter saemangeumensis]|uniref:hypothetical protein n=1 Tax=Hymenobacter saemangeumensis TaxID=1084522 RepID=UPI0031E7155A
MQPQRQVVGASLTSAAFYTLISCLMNTVFAMACLRVLLFLLLFLCISKVQAQQQQQASVVLPVQDLPFERLTSRQIWNNPRERHQAQASAKRFVSFSGETDSTQYGARWKQAKPALLYRKNRLDSVWTVINLVLPDYASHEVRGPLKWEVEGYRKMDIFKLDTANLDHQGEPEVLLHVIMDCCGSTSHTEWAAVNLIDVNGVPKLLMSALIETRDVGYSSDEGFSIHYEQRDVKLMAEVVVSRIKTNRYGWKSLLTLLKSGRYQYRNGHLVWVGK